jgi:hypothetical protein
MTEVAFNFTCPHCGRWVQVAACDVACGIFRDGNFKSNGGAVAPHLPQSECDALVAGDLIYGCGKPFRYCAGAPAAEVCGYI